MDEQEDEEEEEEEKLNPSVIDDVMDALHPEADLNSSKRSYENRSI